MIAEERGMRMISGGVKARWVDELAHEFLVTDFFRCGKEVFLLTTVPRGVGLSILDGLNFSMFSCNMQEEKTKKSM